MVELKAQLVEKSAVSEHCLSESTAGYLPLKFITFPMLQLE